MILKKEGSVEGNISSKRRRTRRKGKGNTKASAHSSNNGKFKTNTALLLKIFDTYRLKRIELSEYPLNQK